ncbi:hypothetical protein P0D91_09205 [Pseudomonas sp. CBSPBW29]|uniref:hypothetical protein n=1 Tax=Pseudomonas TaxID=286 RepID=UPI0021AD29A6|nr:MULTISPECIES: hypothetical protein [unclassified Pseudomonas]WEL44373.1 hypothetical protein P0D91_09205 [Pseudomonas sp. CBSPBW29]WEL65460.1 hypothetical protein P0D93_03315 [Pseudomonas sp. CBSPGW29]WEL68930.1 hypothetical protein P0D94_22650 [Pseudomonas sp. CBSPCGW29]WEL75938.1 hypothetical protein P0D92_28715 [Pseudomonas sp. CBSPAW29]WEL79826.1 hypothetical protein P0D95_17095 [Pseudomonas sp. CBSPCAW29]WEL88285.1 hypothetical protein P0D90_32825 [Pseudomonas sp. CBSPCBW29]
MSTTVTPAGGGPTTQKASTSVFDDKLNISKSSKVIADYMRQSGKSAITKQELSQLASNASGNVPADVSAAAQYMERHPDVFTAIETHDVAGADNLSGVWNFDWAANGGLNGTATDAIAKMQDTFDFAIAKSAQITEISTGKKAELDSTKQRPQN